MKQMKFRGKIYRDGGRLKLVFDKPLPRGRVTLLLTRVDGKAMELKFDTTITNNDPYRLKCRLPPFPELRPGAVVEGIIEDELRCRWCGAKCSALINNLCDHCFEVFNSPYKPPLGEGWGRLT
ncbi:MAG: hypothetical protein QXG41_07335 [Candidatus Caldarchaeum sp.]